MKGIGPTFDAELRAAGLSGLPFSWGDDGVIYFRDDMPQAQRDAVLAVYGAHDPTKPLVLPDAEGFLQALKTSMGGILNSNALAKAYPLFEPALREGIWLDVQALIADAKAGGALNAAQYTAFQSLAAKFNLPMQLP